MIKNCLNPAGHQIRISGSKVKAILLKGWILPSGGGSAINRATPSSSVMFGLSLTEVSVLGSQEFGQASKKCSEGLCAV